MIGEPSTELRFGSAEPGAEAAEVLGSRPRALLVGGARRLDLALDGQFELHGVAVDEATASLVERDADVVVLDPEMASGDIETLLAARPLDATPAFAILGPTPGGWERALGRHEVASLPETSDGEIGPRLAELARTRRLRTELRRREAELMSVREQLEHLQRRMADDLRLAGNVQRSLIPMPREHPRIEFAREFIPYREIGGDHYDMIWLGPNRVAMAIGDMMGKGVPAALLVASLKAALRAQLPVEGGIADVVARVNQLLCEVIPEGKFATFFLGIFDLESRRLEYVNAGHHYPFVLSSDGRIRDLDVGGTVLGLIPDSRYERAELELGRDDLFVFYTDGVTDRISETGELYGIECLKEAAARSRGDSARIALYSLLGEVQGFSGGRPQDDDLTLVVARVR